MVLFFSQIWIGFIFEMILNHPRVSIRIDRFNNCNRRFIFMFFIFHIGCYHMTFEEKSTDKPFGFLVSKNVDVAVTVMLSYIIFGWYFKGLSIFKFSNEIR